MKNLKSLIATGMIGAGSLIGFNGYGQSYTEKEGEKAFEITEGGLMASGCEQLALGYLDQSIKVLSKQDLYSSIEKKLIPSLEKSLAYLDSCEATLNLFLKYSKKNNIYENKSLGLTIGFETKLDTNEVKKLLPQIIKLKNIQRTMLEDHNKINELSLSLLNEKYADVCGSVADYLK